MKTQEQQRQWREKLEELGPDRVRQTMAIKTQIWEPTRYGIGTPTVDFVNSWLAEKDAAIRRRNTRRFWTVVVIAFFTLIPAWIAAYPVLCRWLPTTWTLLKNFWSE